MELPCRPAWRAACLAALFLTACNGPSGDAVLEADAGDDRTVEVGSEVVLDAAGSQGEIETYAWAFEARPGGSSVGLQDAEREQARFTPDASGEYRVSLTVTGGGRSDIDTVILTAEPQEGVRLGGEPERLASDAVYDLHVPMDPGDGVIEEDPETGQRVVRTEIVVEFTDEATAGDVDALLDELDGAIVSMVRRVPTVVVRVPDPGDLAAVDTLVSEVEAREAVGAAWASILQDRPSPVPEAGAEPAPSGEIDRQALPTLGTVARVNHHQAVRGPAAWNARAALPNLNARPWLVIGDFFGAGAPTNGDGVQATGTDYLTGSPNRHGYHVLGIATGAYGAAASTTARSDVTGLFPRNQRTRAVDLAGNASMTRAVNRLVQRMNAIADADGDANIIVNTSIGFTNASQTSRGQRNRPARTYARMVRRNDHDQRMVHLTSAGNTGCSVNATPCPAGSVVRWNASDNSPFAFAALGNMRSWLATPIANLDNVLVVENRAHTAGGTLQRPVPTCADDSSIMGGHLSAIGRQVWSFGTAPSGAFPNGTAQGASSTSGTSMATPQVAGLAAMVWGLDPSLSPSEVTDLLTDTARNDYPTAPAGNTGGRGCHGTAPQPVVDALNAVLAVGGNDVHRAMLDVAGAGGGGPDGTFDEDDLASFASAYGAPPALTYDRFDLNGDGVTDGAPASTRTARVDLDGDRSLGSVASPRLGASFTIDESAATDADVLCHFAYSPLYQGSDSERNRLLGQLCGLVDVEILDPSTGETFPEGERVHFAVEVSFAGQHGGDLILSTGGTERDRVNVDSTHRGPVTTLDTRRICPGDPVAEVAFQDASTGLRATDTVRLNIVDHELSVSIAPPKPRDVRVLIPAGESEPAIEPFELSGRASVPTCEDPASERIDQGELAWIDPDASSTIGSGPTLQLDGDYLADGSGGFEARDVALEAGIGGEFDGDTLEIRPCTSELGLNAGESPVEGYPECSLHAVFLDIASRLIGTFGTADPDDVADLIAIYLNFDPLNQNVLDELDREPCDPRFCDPMPPGFPATHAELSTGFYGDRSADLAGYLDALFDALDAPTTSQAEGDLRALRVSVTGAGDLGADERRLFATAATVAQATLSFFAPAGPEEGDVWETFGFAGDPATLSERVDPVAPARRAVEGVLTTIVELNFRAFEDGLPSVHVQAATYAAALEALVQAEAAADVP